MNSSSDVALALDRFIERALAHQLQQVGHLPRQPYDPAWVSACYTTLAEPGHLTEWRPVRRDEPDDLFDRIGEALELPLHPDIARFYGRYWSDPLPAHNDDGRLNLLQLWNAEDGERLRANLIGHALAKRQQKQPLTLFFACTEPDDLFLSLDNETGAVWLEAPGKKPLRRIADNLATFLDNLQPDIIQDQD